MKVVGNTLIIEPGEIVETGIIPAKKEELHRNVVVKDGAEVRGSIVADRLYLHPGTTIRGGVLASQVLFNIHGEGETAPYEPSTIRIEKDVASLSMVSVYGVSLSSMDMEPRVIYVGGNVIAPHMVRIANAVIEGNILSGTVELRNVIARGILGLLKSEHLGIGGGGSPEVPSGAPVSRVGLEQSNVSTLSNTIVSTIVSMVDVEIVDAVGIFLPMMYFSATAHVRGDGVVKVLRLKPTKTLMENIYSLLARGWKLSNLEQLSTESERPRRPPTLKDLIGDLIRDDNVLYTLKAEDLFGVVALVGVEIVPFVRKVRGEHLLDALTGVLMGIE